MTRARELRMKRTQIHTEAQALLKQDGPISGEDKRKFDMMMSEMDTLKREIDTLEARDEWDRLDGELRETRRPPEDQIGDAALDSMRERRETRAFANYLRVGPNGLSDEDRTILRRVETRDMGIGTGTAGGYFVPQGFVHQVDVAMKYYGNMLGVATIMDTATGAPMPYPTSNDVTNTGALVGEGQQVSEVDVNVGHIMFGAFKFSTNLIKVSLELIQDSAFDLEQFLQEAFAIRLGRILNTKFTVGVGTTEPTGIMTAATAGPTAVGSSGNTGGAETGGTSIGTDDLTALEHSVDPLYRRGAQYMMNDATLKTLRQLKDKYGRPLWAPDVTANTPDTINGYPYSINNDMATIAVNAHTVAFGQLKKYLVRRVKDLMVLRLVERFADYGQIAFVGFARYDGNLIDAGTHPVTYLVQASS